MLAKQLQEAAGNSTLPVYIEDVFSTYLYTGNSSTQTITNGIDLAGKGGLVWLKYRSGTNVAGHFIGDTVRGTSKYLVTNTVGSGDDNDSVNRITSFNSSGFTLGSNTETNFSGTSYVSWSIRKQPKLLDIQTYTGNGTAGRQISHSLGGEVGCIIVKNLTDSAEWAVYHRGNGSTPQNNFLRLNKTSALQTSSIAWNNTAPTTTNFTVGAGSYEDPSTGELTNTNLSGKSYIAYLFAHNAGGFGLTGTDNVISCGSFSMPSDGTSSTVDVGFEPQWILLKDVKHTQNWWLVDTQRGWAAPTNASNGAGGQLYSLFANTMDAEGDYYNYGGLTATGFKWPSNFNYADGNTDYIYIAIRRGPMKVPTDATKVFAPVARTGTGTSTAVTTPNFPPDMLLQARRGAPDWPMSDRLRGVGQNLAPCYTSAENTPSPAYVESYDMTGATLGSGNAVNGSGLTYIEYFFKRAPSFFDEVCYTGTGSARTVTHNLGVAPELIIVKGRNTSYGWPVYVAPVGNTSAMQLQGVSTPVVSDYWNNTTPTASVFSLGTAVNANESTKTYVAYLFATCAGVSKVGSYTGTGTTKQIDCGFTAGSRFVMIKRTDDDAGWYVWDSARGIVSGNDPYLLLNSTAAEVTNTDYVDTYSAGFELSSTAPAAINASGGTFIFLAIA